MRKLLLLGNNNRITRVILDKRNQTLASYCTGDSLLPKTLLYVRIWKRVALLSLHETSNQKVHEEQMQAKYALFSTLIL